MAIDEDLFIQQFTQKLSHGPDVVVPPGDDCAAIKTRTGELQLITVDQVAEDIHYFSEKSALPSTPHDVGRKLLARCISDIAAMAGNPRFALLAITMRQLDNAQWLAEFADGVHDLARDFKIDIIGGDLCEAGAKVSSLTLIGSVLPDHICLRTTAKAGQKLYVTGEFGASLITNKHLNFSPRLREAQWLSKNRFTNTMIDVSDGLLTDLGRVCRSSQLTAIIDERLIPRTKIDGTELPLEQALTDGEDYEILFSVDESKSIVLEESWPFDVRLTQIGQFINDSRFNVINQSGTNLIQIYKTCFNHF